jgi:hypothetical protein
MSLSGRQTWPRSPARTTPGERLIACRNPVLAADRARTRDELLAVTEKLLAPIIARAVAVGKVISKCQTGKHFVITISDDIPEVAIADIRLPPTHSDEGLRAALEIRSHHPSAGVLVLSQYVELGLAMKLPADSAEGVGYLLKTGSATSRTSSPRWSGSAPAARRSTPASPRRSCRNGAAAIRSPC